MRSRKKKWAEPFMAAHAEYFPADFAFLKGQNPLYLEIGCGKGDFALAMHSKFPGCYLAIDRDHSVLATAGRKAFDAKATGIYFVPGDFDFLGPKFAEEGLRFKTIFVNFPDPWPKKRHHKRRLTFAPRLKAMASLLSSDGAIAFKTDNADLFEFSLEQARQAGLEEAFVCLDYEVGEEDAVSEYEANFRRYGIPIRKAVFAPKKEEGK